MSQVVGSTTTDAPDRTDTGTGARVGDSARRPDGIPKVKGHFAFSSDLVADEMLWGRTLRSPHPRARIRSIELGPALSMTGVHAVLTADDVPGRPASASRPPTNPCWPTARFATWARRSRSSRPTIPRSPGGRPRRSWWTTSPSTRSSIPTSPSSPIPSTPTATWFATSSSATATRRSTGDVTVEGTYEVGMQDQAPMGTEAGLAVPSDDGGVELFVSTQFLHVDRTRSRPASAVHPRWSA